MVVTLVLALAAVSGGSAKTLGSAVTLPPGWTHVSVNVIVHHTPETLTYDRGRVTAVSANSLTLHESDGSSWVIPVSSSASITINGQAAALSQVRPLETAMTLSINGAATKVTVKIPPGLAAAIARQQARQAALAARKAAIAARKARRAGQTTTQTTEQTTQTTTAVTQTTTGET
jgi:hypothetical protein